jgi:lysozyme family protein
MSKIEVNAIEPQCGTTLTLGASGDTVSLPSGVTLSGVGTVSWDTTAKTASFTAVSGNGYFVNTTSGAITATLPAGSAGSIVSLKDYANTWNTNNVTVTPNGTDKINGINAYATLNTQDQSITLVYVDDTKGWRVVQDSTSDVTGAEFIVATGGTVTCCGDYKIHTFTGPGTFTVCSVGNPAGSTTVDYLVVAGGGGGGAH